MSYELDQSVRGLVEKQIGELVAKGCLSPSENKTLKEAYDILLAIDTKEAMQNQKQSNGGFSYNGASYGYPNEIAQRHMFDGRVMTPNQSWGGMGSYNSGARENSGYSGHSAIDKMIASLERSLGEASTDYERQQIQEEIHNLRMREMK